MHNILTATSPNGPSGTTRFTYVAANVGYDALPTNVMKTVMRTQKKEIVGWNETFTHINTPELLFTAVANSDTARPVGKHHSQGITRQNMRVTRGPAAPTESSNPYPLPMQFAYSTPSSVIEVSNCFDEVGFPLFGTCEDCASSPPGVEL
jgi:hypothetical protein